MRWERSPSLPARWVRPSGPKSGVTVCWEPPVGLWGPENAGFGHVAEHAISILGG